MHSNGRSGRTSPVIDYLESIHREISSFKDGNVATYIPELAKANPDWFGITLVTLNGNVYETGDSEQHFTIQSISKPFVYGLALEDHGRPFVLSRVGMEPTGEAFNSISLDPDTGRPKNPMINAGAISTTGMVAGKNPRVRLNRLLEMMGNYAGRELGIDEAVYRSENETGHRNRAIAHMLRNFDMVTEDPIPVVDLYFKQCSVAVTCRDLAVMAATLANRGVNPVTGKRAIRGEYVESVLSVMGSCGMYDYAGEWIYKIGMPAKSGVSGGIIAVMPGHLGIGVFSPLLDEHGNSVRGIKVCDEISRSLDLHLFNRQHSGRSVVRVKFNAAELSSSRVRTPQESQVLREFGKRVQTYQLQGHLIFSTTEVVVHEIMQAIDDIEFVVLDLKRALSLNENSCHLLYQLQLKLRAAGKLMVFAHTERLPLLRRFMKLKFQDQFELMFRSFEDLDPALEFCENRLLETMLPPPRPDRHAAIGEYELFYGLAEGELSVVSHLLHRKLYQRGEVIIRAGDEASHLYFVVRGCMSVLIDTPQGARKRLATFSAGMVFGEMAVIDRAPRSAMIQADTDVECDLLGLEDLTKLGETHPLIKIKLLENLTLGLCRKLRKANRELTVLE